MDERSPYVITGATGYIGRRLCNRLVEMGAEVYCLIRLPRSSSTDLPAEVIQWPWRGEFADVISLFKLLGNRKPVIVHLAARAVLREQFINEDIKGIVEANLELGLFLLEAATKIGCKKFINTGSYWQYSRGSEPYSNSTYAATKNAFDQLIDHHVYHRGLVATSLVLTDVYGPDDPRNKVFSQLIQHDYLGEDFKTTPGEQEMNFIHIDDVIEAYLVSMDTSSCEESPVHSKYFVAAEESIKLKEALNLLHELMRSSIKIQWGAKIYEEHQIMTPYVGEHVPNWRANISLREGLISLL